MLKINFYNILWTVVNLLILFAAVKVFLLKPVNKIIEERQRLADAAFEKAAAREADADKKKAEYEASLQGIDAERQQVLAEARSKADDQAKEILNNANEQAEETLKKARANAEHDRERMLREAEHDITELVLSASTKVLASKLPEESEKQLYEKFIDKAGDKK